MKTSLSISALVVLQFLIAAPLLGADMKSLSSSLHGREMAVEYQVLNSGRHVLTVRRIGDPMVRQNLDLDLKEGEVLSSHFSFRCTSSKFRGAYAVISADTAKEGQAFHPKRAWLIDEEKFRLDPATDPNTVSCIWVREGEGTYPFSKPGNARTSDQQLYFHLHQSYEFMEAERKGDCLRAAEKIKRHLVAADAEVGRASSPLEPGLKALWKLFARGSAVQMSEIEVVRAEVQNAADGMRLVHHREWHEEVRSCSVFN